MALSKHPTSNLVHPSIPSSSVSLPILPHLPSPSPGIKREEAKVDKSLRDTAKTGDKYVALILAKEVLQSRKAVSKM